MEFYTEFFYLLLINYKATTNYILILHGLVTQTRVPGGNRINTPHANSLAHYRLDNQGTHILFYWLCFKK